MAIIYMLIVAKFGKARIVAHQLLNYEEIKAIHEVFGRFDILVKIQGKTLEDVEHFIQNNIRTIENIDKAETLVVSNSDIGYDDDDEYDEEPDGDDYLS